MYLDNLPLDITKTPEELIFDKINAVNGLQLDFDDFVFEPPQAYSNAAHPQANTSVKIVPKVTSLYYNSFTVTYKRMSLAAILNNPAVSIVRVAQTQLSELIGQINSEYNINLSATDYYDTALVPVDPLDPDAEVPVMVTAQADSLLFIGSYLLTLNKPAQQATLPTDESADVFVVLDQPYETIHKSSILCRTSNGDTVTNFRPFRNCNTVSLVKIDSILRVKDKGLVLFGNFEFNANLGSGAQAYVSNCILMSTAGAVSQNMNSLFGADVENALIHCSDSEKQYSYVIDPTDLLGTEPTQLYRYNDTGILDTGFSLIGPAYKVIYARIDSQGRIYVCSELLSVLEDHDEDPVTPDINVSQYWVERYLADGSLDTTFSRVTIKLTGSGLPWPVTNIDPVEGDFNSTMGGIYIGLGMLEQPESLGMSPIINGVPLVTGGYSDSFGFLPVVKISETGILDTGFDVKQPAFAPEAIYEFVAGEGPATGDNFVSAVGDSVVVLTYRRNPITGIKHKIPIVYSAAGVMQKVSGDDYLSSYVWTSAFSVNSLKKNSIIIAGECRLPNGTAGYGTPVTMVAVYDPKTKAQGIVYQAVTGIHGDKGLLGQ